MPPRAVRLLANVNLIPRQDPVLVAPFEKDQSDEELLGQLNAALAPLEESMYLDRDEAYPTLHVIGVPRSGTTLLHQILAAGLEIGYVNNLTAVFWQAPVLGLRLAKKLGTDHFDSSFESAFGRTHGISEPHEFGYFWNHHLGYRGLSALPEGHEETIDWARLRRVLLNMAHSNRGPMMFKPMLLIWHIRRMARELSKTCYVWITRDHRETALSLLAMRKSLYGSYEQWASLRPHGPDWLAGEPPWRQVAAQVVTLEREIEAAAVELGSERVLRVGYDDVCARPDSVVEQVQTLLASHGWEPPLRAATLTRFRPRRRDSLEAEFGTLVEEALDDYSIIPADEE
jgi:hypothetical protein